MLLTENFEMRAAKASERKMNDRASITQNTRARRESTQQAGREPDETWRRPGNVWATRTASFPKRRSSTTPTRRFCRPARLLMMTLS